MATEQPRAPKLIINRFTLSQRIEHLTLLLSFTILGITGLVQKFAGNPTAEFLIGAMGGIENVRVIHHIAAIVLLVLSAYHIIAVLNRIFVKRRSMTMLPGLRDVTDGLDVIRYNLGLTKEHPRLPRYNYGEKFEYWAVVWGTAVMAITGFMLWNPVLTTDILPGSAIPAAKAAHGGEAILAILAILVWHVYNVHIKMFNKSIFNGKMPRNQMKEEHAEELVQIDAGISRPLPDEAALRKRERIFLPVALLLAAVMGLAIFWFATYETTAITTLPKPVEVAPVFVPLTATPVASPTVENNQLGAPIPHPIEGQEQCSTCHGPDGILPYPANHAGRPDESCQICHSPGEAAASGATTAIAAAIPHATEGKEQCSQCHGNATSLVPMPTGHIQPVEDGTCTLCHKPAAGASDTEPAMAAPTIPHPVGEDPYTDCTVCHGLDKMKPFPENHANFAVAQCTSCHQPAPAESEATEATATPAGETGTTASGPKPIPHSIEGEAYADCTVCHGFDKMKPFPENHASYTTELCTSCHQPATAATGAETPEATAEATTAATSTAASNPTAATTVTPAATTAATQTAVSTPEAATTAAPSSGPMPIPHSIVEPAYQNCLVCHGIGQLKPFPASHEAFPVSVCAGCHQPSVEQ